MKVLSFSLWGNNPKYTVGAIKNSELAKKFYPDWEMRLYHNDSVPDYVLEQLESNNVTLVDTEQDLTHWNALWRFMPVSEDIECMISRDCDSRLFERDVAAVNEWLESDKMFHIIRDHPGGHMWEINAGMWGCKGGFITNIKEQIEDYMASRGSFDRSIDQCFLRDVIYPKARESLFAHDEYFGYESFSTNIKRDRKLDDYAFIGEPFDENDNEIHNHRDMIRQRY